MAKQKPPVKSASDRVAKGKLSPEQAAKIMHKPNAVLGKDDCSYHNVK